MLAYKLSDYVGFYVFLVVLVLGMKCEEGCDPDLLKTIQQLLNHQENPTMQVQSLKNQLRRILQDTLATMETEEQQEKRSISSLAAWNNLPSSKRNLEALARAGYIRTLPPDQSSDTSDNTDSNYKRSLAVLAKNGQLPIHDGEKRGIESLARNGELIQHQPNKDIQEMLNYLLQKRFLGSLARNGELNSQYKRNMASLARAGGFLAQNKRNVAALLRQDEYWNMRKQDEQNGDGEMDKKNIASIKGRMRYKRDIGNRRKRELDLFDVDDNSEYPTPVYQNQNEYEYEELMKQLAKSSDKRFLGRLPRLGKPKTTQSPHTQTRFHNY